jgi:hypothetical protein
VGDGTKEHSVGAALAFAFNGTEVPSSWSNEVQEPETHHDLFDVSTACSVVECQR